MRGACLPQAHNPGAAGVTAPYTYLDLDLDVNKILVFIVEKSVEEGWDLTPHSTCKIMEIMDEDNLHHCD
jgi:hypothetical protein